MTNAELLTEAINAAITLGWALAAWIAVCAALGTVLLLGATAAVWWACRTLWRHLPRPAATRTREGYQKAA